jgi:hypothetical protein
MRILMRRKDLESVHMTKATVVGLVLLVLSVNVVVCLNAVVVSASAGHASCIVMVEPHGMRGAGSTVVQMTSEQHQRLTQYLVDFRARLNQTTSREEMVTLFKDAVVKLNEYGLLPQGMSVREAQRLVAGTLSNETNLLCLIAGNTNGTVVSGFPLCNLASRLGTNALMVLFELRNAFPVQLGGVLFLGGWGEFMGYSPGPAGGWIYSIGFNGMKDWQGPMHGTYPGSLIRFRFGDIIGWYPGVIGFTGLNIMGENTEHFFLGSALAVSIVEV